MLFLSIKNVLPFADTLLLSNSNWNTGLYIYEDKLSYNKKYTLFICDDISAYLVAPFLQILTINYIRV
jgi:hypothetical protein